MMALSLWQPWATLWLNGPKVHETRPKSFRYRGWLAVHAAKRKPDRELPPELITILERREGINWRWRLPLGKVLGAVYVTDCFTTNDLLRVTVDKEDEVCGDWSADRYAIKREDVIILPEPIDLIGRQGRFYLPDSLQDWFDFHIIKNDLRDAEKIADFRKFGDRDIRDLIRNGTAT